MTRAMEKLYMTYAECRRLYGRETYPRESRFLREIPPEHLEEIRETCRITRPAASLTNVSSGQEGWRLGQRVRHDAFGEGVILQCEGDGRNTRLQVNFDEAGIKWLMLSYAKLEAVG